MDAYPIHLTREIIRRVLADIARVEATYGAAIGARVYVPDKGMAVLAPPPKPVGASEAEERAG